MYYCTNALYKTKRWGKEEITPISVITYGTNTNGY